MALLKHLSLLALLLPTLLVAQPTEAVSLMPDDPVVARLDDLAQVPWIKHSPFSTDTAHHNVHGFAADHIPAWPVETVRQRVAVLDANTPFNLTYNPVVQSYIDLYVSRKREMSSRMLGLSELYFPTFDEYLDRHGIPLEMRYLAVVESALNPAARSRAGAVGLWQFMLPTGRMFGLKADSYVDERHDLYKSTEAACRYLKYLYNLYDNWEMALAAYNCGPGNVNKAIRRSGGAKDYWAIYDHLPRETRGYVPAFIAVNYLFAHHADHNLYPIAPTYCAHEVDTVQVCYPLDLQDLAKLTGASGDELRALNPTFKLGLVPDVDQPVSIYMPREAAGTFVANEESLRYRGFSTPAVPPPSERTLATASPAAGSTSRYHTVRKGESLGIIAGKYKLSVGDLKRMNGLRSDMIRPGQKLVVGKQAAAATAAKPAAKPVQDGTYIYHVVQPGDTLWDIAKRYPGVSVDDLKRLNGGAVQDGLKVGDRIKVGVQEG
jgi:membrane-bound lytic murein transglycosylase D